MTLCAFPSFSFLYHPLFLFRFPFSCLPFAPVATTARFAHYFPFSFILPRLLILCALRKGLPAQEDNFFLLYTIRRATVRSQVFLSSLVAAFQSRQSKGGIYHMYYTLLQNIEHYCRADSDVGSALQFELIGCVRLLFHLPDFNQIVLLGKSEINEFWYTYCTTLENLWCNTSVMRD